MAPREMLLTVFCPFLHYYCANAGRRTASKTTSWILEKLTCKDAAADDDDDDTHERHDMHNMFYPCGHVGDTMGCRDAPHTSHRRRSGRSGTHAVVLCAYVPVARGMGCQSLVT